MKVIKRLVRCPNCISYQNVETGQAWIFKGKDRIEIDKAEMLLRGIGVELVEY